jgi:uncharacterized membrane protein (DUF373 family)
MKILERFLKTFERVVVGSLIVMMLVVILLATLELARLLIMDIIAPFDHFININELLDVFGFFMLIIIGVELLQTIRAYLKEHEVHVEIVLEVALIAIVRKIVILEVKDYSPVSLLAIAAIVISLAGGYYLHKKALYTRNGMPGTGEKSS